MKTTFSRTIFALTAFLLAVLVLVGVSFRFLVQRYMESEAMGRLQRNCAVLVDVAEASQQENVLTGKDFLVNLSVISHLTDTDAVICDANGKLLVCSEDPFGCGHRGLVINESYLNKVFAAKCTKTSGILSGLYEDERYIVSAPIYDTRGNRLGIVITSMPMTATKLVLGRLSERFFTVSVLTALLAAVVATIYAKKHSSPLKEMSKAAFSFGHGNLKARVKIPEKSPEEVQELALAFNNMADSLEKSEIQRQEFVANVSHELKTPMTTIAGFVDGILDGTIPQDQQHKYLQVVSGETKRLSRLVRSMLDVSQLQEQGQLPPEKLSRFELSECVGRCLVTFEQKVSEKQLTMDVQFPEKPLFVRACEDYITQVVYNLMDNAVKFCPQGGAIAVKIQCSDEKAYVTVQNEGQTIPQEELPLLFERFHKLDKSRSENREGWGLGLYIVKTMICCHGENISVTSNEGKTAFTFTMTLVN